jgi:hypothetical protein
MPASKIIIIRHGEEPSSDGTVRGVGKDGSTNGHELSVRGWQRAGALVRYFNPRGGQAEASPLGVPSAIFATAAGATSPSLRPQHTVGPLANDLGLVVNTDFAEREETGLVGAVLAAGNCVLICWHHGAIPAIAVALGMVNPALPHHWPDRYDLVAVLDRQAPGWRFSMLAQRLLPGDLDV